MKKILIILAAVAIAVCSCGKDSGKDSPNNYGYKFPTNCIGEGAVWWMMHENRIYQKPSVEEKVVDGFQRAYYTAVLDLYQCGYLGINDYFGQILAAGYEQDGASADEWVYGSNKLLNTTFRKGFEPYESWGSVLYHKNYEIAVRGNRNDGSVSTKYDAPSLSITYSYWEQ